MSSFIYKSASELANLIKEGKAKSIDVVREHLDQIKKHNSNLNAVIISFEEEALNTAAECDKEAAQGKFRGPLHGVPMTIKEQFWIKGTKSTINFKRLKDWEAPEDAMVVNIAYVIGKSKFRLS